MGIRMDVCMTIVYKMDEDLREVINPSVEGISWILLYAYDIALVTESGETMRAATCIEWI